MLKNSKFMKLSLGAITLIATSTVAAMTVSCGADDSIKLTSTSTREEFKNAINQINGGKIKSYSLDGVTHSYKSNKKNWTKALKDFLNTWYPTLVGADDVFIETGYLNIDIPAEELVTPEIGNSFEISLPKLPKGLYYMYKCDEVFMDTSPAGDKVEYWTQTLKSLKISESNLTQPIKLEVKVAAEFGRKTTLVNKVFSFTYTPANTTTIVNVFEHFKSFTTGVDGKPTSTAPAGTQYVYSTSGVYGSFTTTFPGEWITNEDYVYYSLAPVEAKKDSIILSDLPKIPTKVKATWSTSTIAEYDTTALVDELVGADDYALNAGNNEEQFQFPSFITAEYSVDAGDNKTYSTKYPDGLQNGNTVYLKLSSTKRILRGTTTKAITVDGVRIKLNSDQKLLNARIRKSDGQLVDENNALLSNSQPGFKLQYSPHNYGFKEWHDAPIYAENVHAISHWGFRWAPIDPSTHEVYYKNFENQTQYLAGYGKDVSGSPLWNSTDADYEQFAYLLRYIGDQLVGNIYPTIVNAHTQGITWLPKP